MPQTCTICRHPARTAIDTAVQHGTTLRTVADQYDVSKTALIRHKQHAARDHIGGSWAALAAEAHQLHEHALAARDIVGWVQVLRAMARLLARLCEVAEDDSRPS